ncbi:hypothetical protein GW17_00047318 [Ensete ventricosum]|nr:hypothetical protein GW17_00047318 [Ensete ventricosum]
MNNYHIYEAIGRGKHSMVYKGRKKKTIEYYAIKSVEKSQRYETSAHLWLVLEYCVGGDILTLLKQDSRTGCRYADRSLPCGFAKNRSSTVDFGRRRPIEGKIDRQWSISVVGGRFREKLIVGCRSREKSSSGLFPRAIVIGALSLPAGRQRPSVVVACGSQALFLPCVETERLLLWGERSRRRGMDCVYHSVLVPYRYRDKLGILVRTGKSNLEWKF